MAAITEDYCSYEVAKLLKENEFDEECRAKYLADGNKFNFTLFHYRNSDINENACSAPTLQMAMKWLREKHRIFIEIVHLDKDRHTYYLYRYHHNQSERYVQHTNPIYSTYEQACETALKYCLENLI